MPTPLEWGLGLRLEIEWNLDRRKAERAQAYRHLCVGGVGAKFAVAHRFTGAVLAARAARHDSGAVSLMGVFAFLALEKGAAYDAPVLPAQARYPPLERRYWALDLDGRVGPGNSPF